MVSQATNRSGPGAAQADDQHNRADAASEHGPGTEITTAADLAEETDRDRRWISLAAAQLAPDGLGSIGVEFYDLLRRRDAVLHCYAQLTASDHWSAAAEAQRDAALDPVQEQLYRMACRMVDLKAGSPAEQRLKALALAEFCEERSDDVVHRLAASLAADLLKGSL